MLFDETVFKFLIDRYKEKRVNMCSCHCRDLLDWMVNNAHYRNEKPKLTKETILASWDSYFVEM